MSDDLTNFLRGLDLADQRVRDELLLAVNEYALVLLGRSRELVPVSPTDPKHPLYIGTSGSLRASGAHVPPTWSDDGRRLTAEVGYHTRYALAVHERLDANHRYPGAVNPNAQAKYLSTAIDELAPRLVEHVGERVKSKLSGGAS